MDLGTAQQILVIVLATALAIFLILSIVTAIMVIGLIKALREVAEKAGRVVESAEIVTDIFKKAAAPMTILRFARSIADMIAKHKDNQNKE